MKNTTDKSEKNQKKPSKVEKIKTKKTYLPSRKAIYITESDKNNSEKWIY